MRLLFPHVSSIDELGDLFTSSYNKTAHPNGTCEAFMPLLEIAGQLYRESNQDETRELLRRYALSWLVQLSFLIDTTEREALHRQLQGATRQRMLREAAEILVAFTSQQGLVLVFEDLHWSDDSPLEWLSYIAKRREPAKLLIIGSYRPTEVLATNHPLRGVVQKSIVCLRCEELWVAPLSKQAVSEGTIKVHLHHIDTKLRLKSRKALFFYALERGLE